MGRPGKPGGPFVCRARGFRQPLPHTWAADHLPTEERPLKKLLRLLRSQRGDLLVDSVFSAVVLSTVMAASAALVMSVSAAASGGDAIAARTILLNSVLSEEQARGDSYTPSPQALTRPLLGRDVSVYVWRETVGGASILKAAVSKEKAQDPVCSTALDLPDEQCITSQKPLPGTPVGGIRVDRLPLQPGTDGAMYEFAVPAGATELRYVFKAASVPAASQMVFANKTRPGATHTVDLPVGQHGYFYGRIIVTPGDVLTLTPAGTAAYDPQSFLIYEAP